MKIIVDLDVWNCQIRAFKPDDQSNICPTNAVGKLLWYQTIDQTRLNKRVMGTLKGKGLKKAEKIVDREGAINISGWYGSIIIDENDFVPNP
jgi:hypothetical protein